MVIRHWLTVFGVLHTSCSDRGPQFTGGWLRAMCSLMSNGQNQVAGRQLSEKLPKIHLTIKCLKLFEEMWPALKAHHDTPTTGGMSPHQILFGRDPLDGGLPLSCDGMAMDAKEFFARQETMARHVCHQLEKKHAPPPRRSPCPGPYLAPAPPPANARAFARPLHMRPPSAACQPPPFALRPRSMHPRSVPCPAPSSPTRRPPLWAPCPPAPSCPAWTTRRCNCGSLMSIGVRFGAGARAGRGLPSGKAALGAGDPFWRVWLVGAQVGVAGPGVGAVPGRLACSASRPGRPVAADRAKRLGPM